MAAQGPGGERDAFDTVRSRESHVLEWKNMEKYSVAMTKCTLSGENTKKDGGGDKRGARALWPATCKCVRAETHRREIYRTDKRDNKCLGKWDSENQLQLSRTGKKTIYSWCPRFVCGRVSCKTRSQQFRETEGRTKEAFKDVKE